MKEFERGCLNMWCWCGVGVVWCGVVWCGVVWCGVVPFGSTLAVCRPPWASFCRILGLFWIPLGTEGAQKVMKRCFFINSRVFLEIFRKHCRLWLVTNAVLLLVFFVLRWTERSEAERGRSKLIALHTLLRALQLFINSTRFPFPC